MPVLPSKVMSYLRRMHAEYVSSNPILAEIIESASVGVDVGVEYDNWNGGTHGHDVRLYLPLRSLNRVRIDEQKAITDLLVKHLNACAESVDNEYIRAVILELEDEDDFGFQIATAFSLRPAINPESVFFWKAGHVRLFVSHRDAHKVAATDLATSLERFGISAFVAHDTIQPMSTWQHEILKGLETMEVMLAFVTDDFHESVWVNQEVGYALGKGIPIIPFKLENRDPEGFLGSIQALKGRLTSPADQTREIYRLIAEKVDNRGRMQGALVESFATAPDFNEARDRFDVLDDVVERLSSDEESRIVRAFAENDQLHNAIYLTNPRERLVRFLYKSTGKRFRIEGRKLKVGGEA